MGPAKVLCQDGKVIFIRNGANIIRVSVNRIVKAGSELAKKVLEKENVIDNAENVMESAVNKETA